MPPPEPAADRPATQRLFFALWPDAAVRAQLAGLAREQGRHSGRTVPADNLHLTLAFIGAATQARRLCMETAAAGVRGAPFTLVLDRLGFWPRPKVLWAGCSTTPTPLQQLVQDLEAALAACGHVPEARPYQAHVTLTRKANRPPQYSQIEPLHWPVNSFCLAASVTAQGGAEYRVLRRWPL